MVPSMSNSVQYFAGFSTANMNVGIGLSAIAVWPDAHGELCPCISEQISFRFTQLWPDASEMCKIMDKMFRVRPRSAAGARFTQLCTQSVPELNKEFAYTENSLSSLSHV